MLSKEDSDNDDNEILFNVMSKIRKVGVTDNGATISNEEATKINVSGKPPKKSKAQRISDLEFSDGGDDDATNTKLELLAGVDGDDVRTSL
jgi:hypothetical protein